MIPRSEPAGISGSHHWMNSISVWARTLVAHNAQTAAADIIVVRKLLTLMLSLPGMRCFDPFRNVRKE